MSHMIRLTKRFQKEIDNLNKIDDVFCDETQDISNGIELNIFGSNYLINTKLTFDRYYPFTPPDVNIIKLGEEKNYIEFLGNIQCYFNSFNKEVCLCCESITCKNKWSPNFDTIKVVKEMIEIFTKCKLETNKAIKKAIYLKHLGYDLN